MAMPVAELLFGRVGGDSDAGGGTGRASRALSENTAPKPSGDTRPARPSLDDEADAALVIRVRAGDISATEQLFRAHYAPLVRYARRFSGSVDAAEDLAQDALVRFFEQQLGAQRQDPPRSVAALLRTMVRRRAINEWKHERRAGRAHESAQVDDVSPGTASSAELPNVTVERAEVAAAVRRAFDALPPRARLIATMRWGDGLGRQEIAAELGVSVRTVDAQLYLAAGRVRASLEAFR